jgi:hypothetical protein
VEGEATDAGAHAEIDRIMERFAGFAEMSPSRAPLYHRLATGVAADREVAARLLLAHPDQRQPVLLFAAVHDVLLAGDTDPLRHWYSSVVPEPTLVGGGTDDPWPHFRRMVLEHDGVAERIRTRNTQTNEVGRCATTMLALAEISADAPGARPGGGRPLGLVEIGASAGLNLRLDAYGYRWIRADRAGDRDVLGELHTDSPLVLDARLRGDVMPPMPTSMVHIASRVGVDLAPVDLHDRAATRWLVACQWPDQPDRVHRARAAIALGHADPARVVRGDAVDELVHLVASVPPHALPVVMSTWVLSYFTVARRQALIATLDRIGEERDITLVFAEQPDMVPGLPVPPRPDEIEDPHPTALVRIDWRRGAGGTARSERRLADQHPHGTWVEWLAGPAVEG